MLTKNFAVIVITKNRIPNYDVLSACLKRIGLGEQLPSLDFRGSHNEQL